MLSYFYMGYLQIVHSFCCSFQIGEDKNDSVWSKHLVNNVTGSNIESFVEINGLESDQAYAVRTLVIYNSGEPFTWPPMDNVSIFKTLRESPLSLAFPLFLNSMKYVT